jgi:hypothetical protein
MSMLGSSGNNLNGHGPGAPRPSDGAGRRGQVSGHIRNRSLLARAFGGDRALSCDGQRVPRQWSCPLCTLDNEGTPTCVACGASAPAPAVTAGGIAQQVRGSDLRLSGRSTTYQVLLDFAWWSGSREAEAAPGPSEVRETESAKPNSAFPSRTEEPDNGSNGTP